MKAISVLKHITTFCGVGLHNDCVEAIAELEEAMKPKTCEGCVYDDGIFCLVDCVRRFTHNAYKPKDNA